jgi:hypothetical protein
VDGTVSIGEYVEILYHLLAIDRVGSGDFVDVDTEDSCYKAAATLKELGMLEGAFLFVVLHLEQGALSL